MNKKDISILAKKVKNSDFKAFSTLYYLLWEKMFIRAVAIINDKDLAKDIVQEVWIDFWERRSNVTP